MSPFYHSSKRDPHAGPDALVLIECCAVLLFIVACLFLGWIS